MQSEKEQLARVMERHGFEWEQKGTHEQHLSVIDYKKQERTKELTAVEEKLTDKAEEFNTLVNRLNNLKDAEHACHELEQKLEQSARTLSSGEQQKLSFLRALIFEPKLIVVDETLSNLDPDSASLFMETIREHQRKTPVTWIIISHQLVQIRAICDRVHFMEGGRHLAEGTPEELLLHPEVPAVREFLASTEVSFGSS